MEKKSKKLSFFGSKALLVLGIVVLVIFSIALTKEIVRKVQINKEISVLKQEIGQLEATNTELADLIQYLNSTSWQEKQARTKLNLQKPGESVIAILNNQISASELADNNTVTADGQQIDQSSNPKKWFKYFFN